MSELNFARLVRTTINTAKRLVTAGFRVFDQSGNDDSGSSQEDVEVVMPAGLMARIPATANAEAVVLDLGEQLVCIALVDKTAPAQDVAEGETRLYGVNGDTNKGANMRITPAGLVALVAQLNQNMTLDTSGTGDVVVNGGTAAVGRVGDAVNPTTLFVTWLQGLATAASYPNPLPATFATIHAGAPHFKA